MVGQRSIATGQGQVQGERRHIKEAFGGRQPPHGSLCPAQFSHCQRSHRQAHVVGLTFVFQFVDMMGWRLETADRVDMPVSFNPGSGSVVADLQELPSAVHSASWIAPLSYLGDKVMMSGSLRPCWASSIRA